MTTMIDSTSTACAACINPPSGPTKSEEKDIIDAASLKDVFPVLGSDLVRGIRGN